MADRGNHCRIPEPTPVQFFDLVLKQAWVFADFGKLLGGFFARYGPKVLANAIA
jgi:hypothetical protein